MGGVRVVYFGLFVFFIDEKIFLVVFLFLLFFGCIGFVVIFLIFDEGRYFCG